jgi:hypothetical protein
MQERGGIAIRLNSRSQSFMGVAVEPTDVFGWNSGWELNGSIARGGQKGLGQVSWLCVY